jgi:Zn-dependent protease
MRANFDVVEIAVYLGCLVFSITLHEFMHAFTSYKLGDRLAHSKNRISLNPLQHIDPLTTVALPLILLILGFPPFLAAKPVPVQTQNLKFKEFGFMMVALAGPLTNLVIAAIAALFLRTIGGDLGGLGLRIVISLLTLNVSMFIFNMIPVPPLDGSRVVYAIGGDAVRNVLNKIEGYGMNSIFILVFLIYQGAINLSSETRFIINILLGR